MLLKICSEPLKPIKLIGAVLPLKIYVKLLKSIFLLVSYFSHFIYVIAIIINWFCVF